MTILNACMTNRARTLPLRTKRKWNLLFLKKQTKTNITSKNNIICFSFKDIHSMTGNDTRTWIFQMKRQVRAKRMEWHIITRPTGSQLLFSFSRVIIFGIPSWCFLGGLKAELVTGTGICGYTRCLKAMCDENCMSSSFHMIRSSCRSWTRRKAPKTANDTNKTQAPVVLVIHSERFRAGNTAGRHWHTRISVSRGLSRISKGPVSQANKKEKRKRKKGGGGGGG